MTWTDITNGTLPDADEVMGNFNYMPFYYEADTTTDLDSTITVTSGNSSNDDENSHEYTAISATNLKGADFLKIELIGRSRMRFDDTANNEYGSSIQIKVQTKEIGGSYSDSSVYEKLSFLNSINSYYYYEINNSWVYYHELTSGEKTNGVQLKVFIKADVYVNGTADGTCSATYKHMRAYLTSIASNP